MIRKTSSFLAGVLLYSLLATPSSAEPGVDPADTGLVLPSETCRGFFIVPVTFGGGQGPVLDLLLDTGSSWTLLDPGAIQKVSGVKLRAGKARFRGVRIGSHEPGPLKVYALSMGALSLAVGRDLDGIIGFPAFRDVLLTLDYPSEEIRVSSGSLPRPDGHEIFRAPGKRPHLRVPVGGRRLELLLDSGYSGGFHLKRSDRLAWSIEPRPATSAVTAYGFLVKNGGRLDHEIRFGPLDFENPVVILGHDEAQVGWQVL